MVALPLKPALLLHRSRPPTTTTNVCMHACLQPAQGTLAGGKEVQRFNNAIETSCNSSKRCVALKGVAGAMKREYEDCERG